MYSQKDQKWVFWLIFRRMEGSITVLLGTYQSMKLSFKNIIHTILPVYYSWTASLHYHPRYTTRTSMNAERRGVCTQARHFTKTYFNSLASSSSRWQCYYMQCIAHHALLIWGQPLPTRIHQTNAKLYAYNIFIPYTYPRYKRWNRAETKIGAMPFTKNKYV